MSILASQCVVILSLLLFQQGITSKTVRDTPRSDDAGTFDYYVLSLSWSPEFCAQFPRNPQCSLQPGLVIHGLWPQNYDGSWPSYCNPNAHLQVSPLIYTFMTVSLVSHEWASHGTCTGLTSAEYFDLMLQLFQKLTIPSELSRRSHGKTMSIDRLKQSIVSANRYLHTNGISVTCEGRYLEGIQICFSRSGAPSSCPVPTKCNTSVVIIRANNIGDDGAQTRSK